MDGGKEFSVKQIHGSFNIYTLLERISIAIKFNSNLKEKKIFIFFHSAYIRMVDGEQSYRGME
jgi:hypothetical protein